MANKIQVKRGKEVNLPILDVGEPAFTTDTKKPFIGSDSGNIELATKEQINDLDAEVDAHKADYTYITAQQKRALSYYWIPESQPPARQDHEGWFTNAYSWTSDQYIENNFEPLRLEHEDYVTRTNLGKDQSGEYDIWRYHFTPKNYKKTIIIQTGLHGGEITPAVIMMRFLHYLCNEWEKYPQLAYIRENVRIIYTPFVNPWGMSQLPRTRYNSRGVDLNRNFPYLWDSYTGGEPFSQSYKGESPLSEIESQYVVNTLNEYDDVVTFLDLHNTGTPSWDYYVPIPQGYSYNQMYEQLFAYFTKDIDNPSISNNESQLPTAPNYAYNLLGVPSSGPEWNDTRFGGQVYSSEDLTKALEWFANVIIEHCREFGLDKPIVKEEYFTFSGTALPLSGTDYTEITELKGSMKVPSDGVVTYEGFLVILSGTNGGLYNILPLLGAGSAYNVVRATEWDVYANTSASERIIIPFQASIPINKKINSQEIFFGISAKVTSGDPGLIYRYRARVTFIPMDLKNYTSRKIIV